MAGNQEPPNNRLYPVTVRLSMAELSAVSRAAFVVTSPGEVGFINAADRGLRKLRDIAKTHADLPTDCKGTR
ncbi:hypothetical protein [Actinokineospora sp.]|uniref:hypothetical protein n=1 Tax=Actinokineospora sp. TaxID=1872133 RepID=UPI00403769A2